MHVKAQLLTDTQVMISTPKLVNEDLHGMIVVYAVVDGYHGGAGSWYLGVYEMRIHRD
jgi:hypothetical protein